MEYAFHIHNRLAQDGVAMSLNKLLQRTLFQKQAKTKGAGTDRNKNRAAMYATTPSPVIVCVGSDLAIGDCLGPITGSMLQYKTQGLRSFLYGTLATPVTAKEIRYIRRFLHETHENQPIVAIDAAIGNEGDIGLIKITDTPLFPGAGANKQLGELGDISVMGIVAEKSVANYNLLNGTRLNLVYKMADIISDAIATLLWEGASRACAEE